MKLWNIYNDMFLKKQFFIETKNPWFHFQVNYPLSKYLFAFPISKLYKNHEKCKNRRENL